MFFLLSKSLDVLVDPFAWVFGLMLGGILVLARAPARRRLGFSLAGAGLGLLVLTSAPAVSFRLAHVLEASAEDTSRPGVVYDVVVLLGGTVAPEGSVGEEPGWNESVERLLTTYELLRTGRARTAIVSGGLPREGLLTEAEYLKRQLVAWGIAPERVLVEDQAMNTRQNALFSKAIVAAHGFGSVLVVTSAFHQRRAAGCFRAVGLAVDWLPVDYRAREPAAQPYWAPRAEFFAMTGRAVREAFGRLVYAVMGYAS